MVTRPGSNRHVAKVGGRKARSIEWKRERGARVKALRDQLGYTHAAVAERGGFKREKMSKFESGENAATTADAISELAKGFEIPPSQMLEYLDGRISLERILYHVGPLQQSRPEATHEDDARYPALERVIRARPNASRWEPATIAAARTLQLDADEDPGERWWVETMDRLDSAIKVSVPKLPHRGAGPLDDDDGPPVRNARKKH